MKLFSKIVCVSAIFCFTQFVNAQTQAIPSDESSITQCDGKTCFQLVSDDESTTMTNQDQSDDASTQDDDQHDANDDDDASSDQDSNDSDMDDSDIE